MIRHLLQLIWTQRNVNLLIWLELLLVSICLWYVVDFLYVSAVTYLQPLGFDISHTYNLNFEHLESDAEGYIPSEEKTSTNGEDFLKILERIKNYPAVEAVCYSRISIPYSVGSMGGRVRTVRNGDTLSVSGYCKLDVSKEFFQVFRYHTPDGKTYGKDIPLPENGAVITRDFADSLFTSDINSIGQKLLIPMNNIGERFVTGITTPIRYSEFAVVNPSSFVIMTSAEMAQHTGAVRKYDVSLRVSPESDKNFIDRFRKDMKQQLSEGNIYLLRINPMSIVRENHLDNYGYLNELNNRIAIVFFLLMNVFLGVIGTFWYRTQHRKNEVGLRMAMGAHKKSVFNMLISEGLLLLTLAWIPAVIICINLAYTSIIETELLAFSAARFIATICITYSLLALMILLGIWFPARKAVKVAPAEALRDE